MEHDMSQEHRLSRRGLVKAAVGTATVGAVAVTSAGAPALAASSTNDAAASAEHEQTSAASAATEGELVVHVRDARTGDLDLYIGDRHVQVRDRDLAGRLTAAAR